MLKNPKLYEVNTRIWIKQFGENITFSKIPISYFQELSAKGITIVWLMGIWKTCDDLIEECCFSEGLVTSYTKSLKDWNKEDITGSPFAIDDYVVNPKLGTKEELLELKAELNKLGIKLFLDFIPNHFAASSQLIKTNPEIFLHGNNNLLANDSDSFFRSKYDSEMILAHGRDPFFPAWTDTVQVNYSSTKARIFMTDKLLEISEICDGVRCDMAMLPLNNVFNNTWFGSIDTKKFPKLKNEFWEAAITTVKQKNENFVFLAEAYWDLEWELQQLGFDFTYDKRLTDRLEHNDIQGIKDHLKADQDFQFKSARFLENHDENRAVTKFGKAKSYAAAVLISTIQGMKFYYDGQFVGKKIKLPVQLGREPIEKISSSAKSFYSKLLQITNEEIFFNGNWEMTEPLTAGGNDLSYQNLFAWVWKHESEGRLIVINFADKISYGRVKFNFNNNSTSLLMKDLLTDIIYDRSANDIREKGLFVELKPFQSHIFAF